MLMIPMVESPKSFKFNGNDPRGDFLFTFTFILFLPSIGVLEPVPSSMKCAVMLHSS